MYVGLLLLEELHKAEDSIPERAARLHSLHTCLSDPLPANCAPALCVPVSLALFWPLYGYLNLGIFRGESAPKLPYIGAHYVVSQKSCPALSVSLC